MDELFEVLSMIGKILLLVIITIFLYVEFENIYKMIKEHYLCVLFISLPFLWFYINMGLTPYWIQKKKEIKNSEIIHQKIKDQGIDKQPIAALVEL